MEEKKIREKVIIHTYDGLMKVSPLIHGDTINFHHQGKMYEYKVTAKHLECKLDDNRIILEKLFGKNEERIVKYFSFLYGYNPEQGRWPECKDSDYKGLTRAVARIYKLLEHHTEADEINDEDIQAAADMYDEIVSQDSLYINPLKTKQENGKTIKVHGTTPKIRRGEERSGRSVHSRGSQAITRVGHLSNKEVSGYGPKREEQDDW